MNEVIEKQTLLETPLEKSHINLGATIIECEGWRVPASYGDVSAEYLSVRGKGAGLIDLTPRGRIMVGGSEAIQFLNGLITNDMKTLERNAWMPAAFPNVQGRLIASVRVMKVDDSSEGNPSFLLDTEPSTHERVFRTIERFTLAGDFRVTDISNETVQLALQGEAAEGLLNTVLGENVANLPSNGTMATRWQDAELTVVRASHTGADGFDVILKAENASSFWNALLAAGARPVGYEALEVLRIEAGIPRYGIDMDETNVVTETALDDAVSYTKGCYVGQEIIARIKYRGHVAKKLIGLRFNEQVAISAGAVIKSVDDKEIGRVTSVAYSPRLEQTIGLGYVKYDYVTPGTEVRTESADNEVKSVVTDLPFVSDVARQGA